MSEIDIPETAEDKEKLQKIVSKDAKTGRPVTGIWFGLISAMGVGMVLFYMYAAASPVDTQYFLGIYVMVTYVMIMLSYPMTGKTANKPGYYIDNTIKTNMPFA